MIRTVTESVENDAILGCFVGMCYDITTVDRYSTEDYEYKKVQDYVRRCWRRK